MVLLLLAALASCSVQGCLGGGRGGKVGLGADPLAADADEEDGDSDQNGQEDEDDPNSSGHKVFQAELEITKDN